MAGMKLSQVRKLALALPEVTEEPHFHLTSFRVRGKIIATAPPDEPSLNVMVGEAVREPVLAAHADCVEKLFWGKKVMGVRVDLRSAKSALVADLLRQAWRAKAPKSLLAEISEQTQ
jgi:hypothetical protein